MVFMEQINTNRNKIIVKYNAAGIAGNVLLSVFKLIVGFQINAHAVLPDAVNAHSLLWSRR